MNEFFSVCAGLGIAAMIDHLAAGRYGWAALSAFGLFVYAVCLVGERHEKRRAKDRECASLITEIMRLRNEIASFRRSRI